MRSTLSKALFAAAMVLVCTVGSAGDTYFRVKEGGTHRKQDTDRLGTKSYKRELEESCFGCKN